MLLRQSIYEDPCQIVWSKQYTFFQCIYIYTVHFNIDPDKNNLHCKGLSFALETLYN